MADVGRGEGEVRRPPAILLVYSWDVLLAIAAVIGAMASFAGGVSVGGRTFEVPVPLQIIAAVRSGAFAAALLTVATMLTRRLRWVRRAQLAILGLDIVLITVSVATARVVTTHGTDYPALFGNLLWVLIDLTAMMAMTGPRMLQWYSEAGEVPLHARLAIGTWAGGSAALIAFQALR